MQLKGGVLPSDYAVTGQSGGEGLRDQLCSITSSESLTTGEQRMSELTPATKFDGFQLLHTCCSVSLFSALSSSVSCPFSWQVLYVVVYQLPFGAFLLVHTCHQH